MRRHLRSALIAALLPAGAAHAGWTQPEGGHYVKVWGRYLAGDRGFLSDGEVEALDRSFRDVQVSFYGEYGVTDVLTLLAFGTPYGHAALDPGPSTAYVGPLGLGARRALLTGDLRLAFEVRYAWHPPAGDEVLGSGTTRPDSGPGEPWFYQPTVATHRFEGELQVGHGLPAGFWLATRAGAGTYTDAALGPFLLAASQVGWSGPWGLVLDLHLNLYEPLEAPEGNGVSGAPPTRYLGYGLGLSWWFAERWAVNVGGDSVAYAASNAAAAPLTFGLEHRAR